MSSRKVLRATQKPSETTSLGAFRNYGAYRHTVGVNQVLGAYLRFRNLFGDIVDVVLALAETGVWYIQIYWRARTHYIRHAENVSKEPSCNTAYVHYVPLVSKYEGKIKTKAIL